MKATDTPAYTLSSGNIFADLQVKNPEEAYLKAQMARAIAKVIKSKRLTQAAAGQLMGLKQPKVSEVLSGRLTGYSVERLMRFLNLLGHDVEITAKAHRSKGVARSRFIGE